MSKTEKVFLRKLPRELRLKYMNSTGTRVIMDHLVPAPAGWKGI